jgi:small nuclear ribonucleoprotein G
MPKVQPPELKKFMDKKLNGAVVWCIAVCNMRAWRGRLALGPLPSPCHCPRARLCAVTLNLNRQVTGVLRGFDQFMNMVLDGTVDVKNKVDIGMVVSARAAGPLDHTSGCIG